MKDPYLYKRTVLVDFDGVIHRYSRGWKGPTDIYDDPVEGAFEFLYLLVDHPGIDPQIYSSRSKLSGGVVAMKDWFRRHGFEEDKLKELGFPAEKPAAWLTIDDRAFCFRGVFPTTAQILDFRSWIQQE